MQKIASYITHYAPYQTALTPFPTTRVDVHNGQRPEQWLNAPTILVVDDDSNIRDFVAQTLSDEGYEVVTCGDGHVALELAKSRQPAMILLDLMMPKMSGWQVMSELKQSPASANIPIALVSASANLAQTARELGATTYLPKPFDLDSLVAVVTAHARVTGYNVS